MNVIFHIELTADDDVVSKQNAKSLCLSIYGVKPLKQTCIDIIITNQDVNNTIHTFSDAMCHKTNTNTILIHSVMQCAIKLILIQY